MKTKKIFLTGGGSAGHVTPNIALIEPLKKHGWTIEYVGTANGIEKQLIEPLKLPYHTITTGKLRRYFSWQNFTDPFKLLSGITKSYFLCLTKKPDVVFSKGGFVSFPLVVGAWLNRIPVILHESDTSPGLANKLSLPFVKHACITFPESAKYFKKTTKTHLTGTPIRADILQGDQQRGLTFLNLKHDKPIILIICGSVGSTKVNTVVRQALTALLEHYAIIHLCGKNDIDPSLKHHKDYRQFEYLNQELGDVFACADLVVSRAGANSLYEVQALKKPSLLVPFPKIRSRGEQVTNAYTAKENGFSEVVEEDKLTSETLIQTLVAMFSHYQAYQNKLNKHPVSDSVTAIIKLIETHAPRSGSRGQAAG